MAFKNIKVRTFAFTIMAITTLYGTIVLAQSFSLSDVHRTVLIVDESGSMGRSLDWLGSFLESAQVRREHEVYDSRLTEFGLVMYTAKAKSVSLNGKLFDTMSEIGKALESAGANGGDEDGYLAIREALDVYGQYSQHSSNGLHLVLFSDEDRDVKDIWESFDSILSELVESGTTLDVVVSAQFTCEDGREAVGVTAKLQGYVLTEEGFELCERVEITSIGGRAKTTVPDYVLLAHSRGGTAWQIGAFRHEGMLRVALKQPDRFPAEIRKRHIENLERKALAPVFGAVQRAEALLREPEILVAHVSANPSHAAPGEIIMLNAGDSKHMIPQEYIESWNWDLDDDGEEDAWGEVVATSFDVPGDHVIVLQVLDGNGNAAHARLVVHVE